MRQSSAAALNYWCAVTIVRDVTAAATSVIVSALRARLPYAATMEDGLRELLRRTLSSEALLGGEPMGQQVEDPMDADMDTDAGLTMEGGELIASSTVMAAAWLAGDPVHTSVFVRGALWPRAMAHSTGRGPHEEPPPRPSVSRVGACRMGRSPQKIVSSVACAALYGSSLLSSSHKLKAAAPDACNLCYCNGASWWHMPNRRTVKTAGYAVAFSCCWYVLSRQ